MELIARGGLEPGFRVLFSAIFHGAFLGNFHQGRNLRKWAEAKVWHFVADLHTKFLCVLVVLCLSTVDRSGRHPVHASVRKPRR